MKKNLHLNRVLCALAILAAGGCSDDSSISTGEPTETCGGQICADPEICQNDRCVVEIALGDDCSAENAVCKTGHCDDATKTCVVDPDAGKIPLGEACTPNDTCAEGGVLGRRVYAAPRHAVRLQF